MSSPFTPFNNYLRHILGNYIPISPASYSPSRRPPTATVYHSVYNQSIPIYQSFTMAITPPAPAPPPIASTPPEADPETNSLNPRPDNHLQPPQTVAAQAAVENEPLDWERPRAPAKRSFFTQFFTSNKRQRTNFATTDTDYYGPSKEGSRVLDGGVLAAGAGVATSTGRGQGFFARFKNPRFNNLGYGGGGRTYFGLSRRTFFLGVVVVLLCLLALILGLAIGLSKKHSSSPSLPLPSSTGIFTGDITYYDPGGPGFGACGFVSYSIDAICAVSEILYDAAATNSDPNDNPLCGKKIRITRFEFDTGENNTVDVKVVDRCTGCAVDDLDLSPSVFAELADIKLGRVVASWAWLD